MPKKPKNYNELQEILNITLPKLDSVLSNIGDISLEQILSILKQGVELNKRDFQHSESFIKRAIASSDQDYPVTSMLITDYINRVRYNKPMVKELELWIAAGLEQILKGEIAKDVFHLKRKPGTQVNMNQRFRIACYSQLLRNKNMTVEQACWECHLKYGVETETINRWLKGIKVPKVSNRTLEILAESDLSDVLPAN